MRKIAITISGCILLLGALFYGLILKNQPWSEAPAPKVPSLKKTEEPTASVPSEPAANSASAVSASENETSGQIDPEIGTGRANAETSQPQTAGLQEAEQRALGNRASKPQPVEDPSALAAQPQAPMGVRLAPDVRLPAAAMPLDFKISSVAKKALDGIVMDYYRDIASIPQANSADVVEESENGELTRIVKNSPAVDEARARADARFKALFGWKAYNRLTMNTHLEVRRPPLPEE
jgi:hypothetical protein